MHITSWMTAAAIAASLTGCYTYPVYQPVPVARLTSAQSAALAQQQQQQPLTQADRDRLARDNAQVAADDQANSYAQATTSPYGYAYPVAPTYYDYPYYAGPYPYYYGGGFYPGVSLSFGFRGFYGGHYGGYGGHYGGGFHHR